ncbi:MAG TPA: MFS transporter [Bauldia sp.]|nr:MFS transporter [Bauldia sp.]
MRRQLSAFRQASLSLYWFATNAHWAAILITLLPLQAEAIGGHAFKGTTLGQILLAGALVSMVVAPLFGAWSDRVRTRWGRRKPFLVVGTIGNVVGLAALAFIPSEPSALPLYIAAFIWIELFSNVATAPYSALIPDVVPAEQRGSASGWLGLMLMLGSFVGGITGLALPHIGGTRGAYLGLAAIMVIGMLGTVLTVKEPDPPAVPLFRASEFVRGLLAPFKSRDFAWVFWTRLLMTLGLFTVQEFLQFYMRDVVAGGAANYPYTFFGFPLADNAPAATSSFILALLVGAVASSLVAGRLSDRHGRKRIVYVSGALQTVVVATLIFSGRFELVVLMGIVFGVGFGAYQAVDWALAADVLPSEDDYAKDMGVWHVAFTAPQVLATPIGGFLLDNFQAVGRSNDQPTLGYTVLLGLACVYFVLGTVLIRNVSVGGPPRR